MNREFIILDTSDGKEICPLGLHECPDFEQSRLVCECPVLPSR